MKSAQHTGPGESLKITDCKQVTLAVCPQALKQGEVLGEAPQLNLMELHPLEEELGHQNIYVILTGLEGVIL